LRNSGLATTYALQVIDEKADCVIDGLAVIDERLARSDEIREFMLWKANRLPTAAL
jgi:hypothetical protein